MCGVQAIVLMPSAAASRAIANDMARSFEPSSIPGSRWECRSINLSPDLRRRHRDPGMAIRPVNPVVRPFYANLQNPLRIRANDAFPQQLLSLPQAQNTILANVQLNHRKFAFWRLVQLFGL
jgi:hypothetical protein